MRKIIVLERPYIQREPHFTAPEPANHLAGYLRAQVVSRERRDRNRERQEKSEKADGGDDGGS